MIVYSPAVLNKKLSVRLKGHGDMARRIKYGLAVLAVIALTLVIWKGLKNEKYYKQYGNPKITLDEISGLYHTPYLSLRKGSYELIVGYHASEDTIVMVGDTESEFPATGNDGEENFMAFNIELSDPADTFCMSLKDDPEDRFGVYEYEIKSGRPFNNDPLYEALIIMFILCGALAVSYTGIFKKMSRQDILVFAVLAGAVILSSLPLFKDYITYGHDIGGQLKRIEGLKGALYEGYLVPTVYPGVNNGYGEVAFNYPYLFLYIPAILRLLGISMPFAYNTFLFLINLASCIFMYICVKQMSQNRAAAVTAACLYVLAPYRLTDMYVRAALGEATAMCFLPVVILGMYHVLEGDRKKYYILTLGFLGLLGSHALCFGMAGILCIITLLFMLPSLLREKGWLFLLKAAGLFCIFFIPYMAVFIRFYPYVNLDGIKVVNFYRCALYPAQLFMSDASLGVMTNLKDGITNEMNQGVGLVGGMILLMVFVRLLRDKNRNRFVTALDIAAIVFLFAASVFCPWNYLIRYGILDTFSGMIQFPFRFITIVTVVLSLEGGVFAAEFMENEKYRNGIFAILLAFSVYAAGMISDHILRQPVTISDMDGGFLTTSLLEYYPKDTDPEIFKNTSPESNGAELTEYAKKGLKADFYYKPEENVQGEATVTLPLLYFPGYTAKDENGKKLEVRNGSSNRVEVVLDKGTEGRVSVRYGFGGMFR